MKNMKDYFAFPEDADKVPLFETEAGCSEKELCELIKNSFMKTSSSKIQWFVTIALCIMFFGYITAVAFFSGAFAAAAVYAAITALLVLLPSFPKLYARRLASLYPNALDGRYRFYKHHFTSQSEYSALYAGYDEVSYAVETDRAFMLYFRSCDPIVISKRGLDKQQSERLRTVMKVKLGSKFRVNFL